MAIPTKSPGDAVTVTAKTDSTVAKSDDSFTNTFKNNVRVKLSAYPSGQGNNPTVSGWVKDANDNVVSTDLPDDRISTIGAAGQGEAQIAPQQVFNLPANAQVGNWGITISLHEDVGNFPQANNLAWELDPAFQVAIEEDDMKLIYGNVVSTVGQGVNLAETDSVDVPIGTFADDDVIYIINSLTLPPADAANSTDVRIRIIIGGNEYRSSQPAQGQGGERITHWMITSQDFDGTHKIANFKAFGWGADILITRNNGGGDGIVENLPDKWMSGAFTLKLDTGVGGPNTKALHQWYVYKLKS